MQRNLLPFIQCGLKQLLFNRVNGHRYRHGRLSDMLATTPPYGINLRIVQYRVRSKPPLPESIELPDG